MTVSYEMTDRFQRIIDTRFDQCYITPQVPDMCRIRWKDASKNTHASEVSRVFLMRQISFGYNQCSNI